MSAKREMNYCYHFKYGKSKYGMTHTVFRPSETGCKINYLQWFEKKICISLIIFDDSSGLTVDPVPKSFHSLKIILIYADDETYKI